MGSSMNSRPTVWNGVSDTWDEAANATASESKGASQVFDTTRRMDRPESMRASARSGLIRRFEKLPILIGLSSTRLVVDVAGESSWKFELFSRKRACQVRNTVKGLQQMGYTLKGNWEYLVSIGDSWERSLSRRSDTPIHSGLSSSLLFKASQCMRG